MAKRHDVEPKIVKSTIRLPEPLERAAKHFCIDNNLSFQDLIIKALEAYLRTKGGK